uniref:DNA mismatch repair proteins mutS family domain-containing protein n=1 Tax=viral metagenome TaxID=1070528 RepID=A0A6C0CJY9_9ZZZZ
MASVLESYYTHQQNFQKRYGPKTIVLLEVGHFYELYALKEDEIEHLKEICEKLNLTLTYKDKKKKLSKSNPRMTGFPSQAVNRYIQILLDMQYTIIKIDQVYDNIINKKGKYDVIERKISNIYSPGTFVEEMATDNDTNYIMSIYFEMENAEKNIMTVGISFIDLTTGKSDIYESFNTTEDPSIAYDNTNRLFYTYNPKEVLIYSRGVEEAPDTFMKHLDTFKDKIKVYLKLNAVDPKFYKIAYQNEFLKKVFGEPQGMLSPIEELDLEYKQTALISYVLLMQFVYEHDNSILNKIQKPDVLDDKFYTSLLNNAMYQLSLINNSTERANMKYNSIYGIINNTSTPLGGRLLKKRMLKPISNKDMLNKRYECIQVLVDNIPKGRFKDLDYVDIEKKDTAIKTSVSYKSVEYFLTDVVDIERLHRRLDLKKLRYSEMGVLIQSYMSIKDLLDHLSHNSDLVAPFSAAKWYLSRSSVKSFTEFLDKLQTTFNLDQLEKGQNIFNKGFNTQLDELSGIIKECKSYFDKTSREMSAIIEENTTSVYGNNKDAVRVEYTDRDGYCYVTTKKRFDAMSPVYSKKLPKGDSFKKTALTNACKFYTTESSKKSDLWVRTSTKIENISKDLYNKFLDEIVTKYGDIMWNLVKFVENIDFVKSCAKTSILNNYVRPTFSSTPPKHGAYIKATSVRHPIIEKINTEVQYIPNDVNLGVVSEDKPVNGMLLFGINAAGKSSYMKSVGVAVVLAQMGMFVPAKSFEFEPFHNIISRITGEDNMFKSQSTFVLEMTELRNILKRSDEYTLVLGDEICHGTEQISGLSIVSSSIIKLEKTNSKFIFATHLHDLLQIPQINELERVKPFNLRVNFDDETNNLIYERTLEPGSGSKFYGLEVCKYIIDDPEFHEVANQIRKALLAANGDADAGDGIILEGEAKQSKYNANVFLGRCAIKDCPRMAEDTHHITCQSKFDENSGMCDHIRKNDSSNLVCLCKGCHNAVHAGDITINGYIQTAKGRILDYAINSAKPARRSSSRIRNNLTQEQIDLLRSLKDTGKTRKEISKMREFIGKNGKHVSTYIINKIWNDVDL